MAWQTVTDSHGQQYRLFLQERSQSCGAAAALTALRAATGKELTGTQMRQAFGDAEGAAHRDLRYGFRDFEAAGSETGAIVESLRKYGSPGWFRTPFNATKVRKIDPRHPAIFGVDWGVSGSGEKGGHWICAVNRYGDTLVCLDPHYGLLEINQTLLPFYFTADGVGRINDALLN